VAALAHAGERRALDAVARLGAELARLGQALDARMARANDRTAVELERARAELAALEQLVARRLRAAETSQSQALAALRAEMSSGLERLSRRMDEAERRAAEAACGLGERLDALSRQTEAGEARLSAALDAELAESRRRTDRLIGELRADLAGRDAAIKAYVEDRLRRPSLPELATGTMLVLAGVAAALSLTAVGAQLIAARTRAVPAAPVRLHLPLRPTLPAELPPPLPPEGGRPRAPAPQARPPAAPAAKAPDYPALSEAIARGDRAALDQVRALALGGAPVAQLLLAKLYEGGEAGLPKDLALARTWTERAAEGGERAAMHNLAVYMINGQGGPADAPGAVRWFTRAAQEGVIDAEFNLALLYENGRGAPKNLVEAYRWYSIAANAGDGLARGRAVALEARLTPRERAAALGAVGAFQPGAAAPVQPVSAPVAPPAATVAESQRLLAREGYFIGRTDGADSPAYRSAVADYLRDHPQAQRSLVTP
jgi:localization factor PodJL